MYKSVWKPLKAYESVQTIFYSFSEKLITFTKSTVPNNRKFTETSSEGWWLNAFSYGIKCILSSSKKCISKSGLGLTQLDEDKLLIYPMGKMKFSDLSPEDASVSLRYFNSNGKYCGLFFITTWFKSSLSSFVSPMTNHI